MSIPRASYGPEGGEWWLRRTDGGVLVAMAPIVPEISQISTKKPTLRSLKGGKEIEYAEAEDLF